MGSMRDSIFDNVKFAAADLLCLLSMGKLGRCRVLEFEVLNCVQMVPLIRQRAVEFASAMPFTQEELDDVALAVGEAGTNACKYGGSESGCTVKIRLERRKDSLHISIRDSGCGFDPDSICPPVEGELREGGRGIIFMKAAMDDVRFLCHPSGTHVEMIKHIRKSTAS